MPFTKGQSGNPSGRRHEQKFRSMLEIALADHGQDQTPRLRKIADQVVIAAEKGERWAIEMIADRLDGKPHQSQSIQAAQAPTMTKEQRDAAVRAYMTAIRRGCE